MKLMMMKSLVVAIVVATFLTLSVAAVAGAATHLAVVSGEWTPVTASQHKVPAALPHRFTLTLRHSDDALARLRATVDRVSDPRSPSYGRYLSAEDLRTQFAPSSETVTSVVTQLRRAGAVDVVVVRQGDAIAVRMPAAAVNALFGVTLETFRRTYGTARHIIRSRHTHTLPAWLVDVVDTVHGVSDFPPPAKLHIHQLQRKQQRTAAAAAAAAAAATDAKVAAPKLHPCAAPPYNGPPMPTSGPGSVAPVIYCARARDGAEVTMTFSPKCDDGTFPATMSQLKSCMFGPAAVTSFTVHAHALHDESRFKHEELLQWGADTCAEYAVPSSSASHGAPATVVACSVTVKVPLYLPIELSVAVWSDGSKIPRVGTNPHPVVATPVVTPDVLYSLYKMPPTPRATTGVRQAVVEFEQQYYSPSDLDLFFRAMGLPESTHVNVTGVNHSSQPGGEASLDIQWIMAMAPGVDTLFYSIAANSTIEVDDILKWAIAVMHMPDPPSVHSLSYGMTEGHVDQYLGAGYLRRSDVELQKLAVRGQTVIIADGDTGAGDLGAPPMSNTECKTMHPDWPSQSPYVTAVGSTYITPLAEPICHLDKAKGGVDCRSHPLGEIAVSLRQGLFWTTGGGFSAVVERPQYQEAVVSHYLQKHNTVPASAFNSAGRAYPDVVTVGHSLLTAVNGVFEPIDGTSASAPIWAGIVSMLNDARARAGGPPMGFMQHFLYQTAASNPEAFTDITVGQNGCGSYNFPVQCCEWDYVASPGWDAVSGLGSPVYDQLEAAALRALK